MFESKFFQNISKWYYDFFSIQEIEKSSKLKFIFWAVVAIFLLDLSRIVVSPGQPNLFHNTTILSCWEHFPNCQKYLFFEAEPFSYAYSNFMALIFGLCFLSCYFFYTRRHNLSHFCLCIIILWKFFFAFILVDTGANNFEVFYQIPAFGYLFTRNKIRNIKALWATIYLFAAFVKIDEAWIVGNYFSSLEKGLPIIPDILIPFASNSVIIFEIIFSITLFVGSANCKKISVLFWTIFHIYSVTLIGVLYPVRCVPFLWILFGIEKDESPKKLPPFLTFRNWPAISIYIVFIFGNFLPAFIPGDAFETFEGMNYGLHMISSNNQCINKFSIQDANGSILRKWEDNNFYATTRCYPFSKWNFHRRTTCSRLNPGEKMTWKLWHSKNGGPFHERINTDDLCSLEYTFLKHNEWIKTNEEGAPIVGYPIKNSLKKVPTIYRNYRAFDQPSIELTAQQKWLQTNLYTLQCLYFLIWGLAFFLLNLNFLRSSNLNG